MIGLGLGLWQNQAAMGAPATPATFTMTQLSAANRVYQRSTTSGGGQSKGQGTIPVTINPTVIGTVYARVRSSDTTTILQASWLVGSVGSTGSQTLNVTGVDARLGWFYLDLSGDGVTFTNGTTLVGMGRVVAVSGQSLATRMFRIQDASVTATNTSLSVTINANSSVYASYDDNNTYPVNPTTTPPAWAFPADGGNYNSTFASEYLNRVVNAAGVNCALVGHSRGQQSITSFLTGGTEVTALRNRLDEVGGFEAFIWLQGHTDSQAGMSNATYQTNLSTLFTDMASHNVARGSTFEKYLTTIPNINSASWGTKAQVHAIRTAAQTWANANGGVSVAPMDLSLVSDLHVHQDQTGNITLAGHFYRASRTSLGLSHNDNGPAFTGSRSGATITLTPTFSSGGTALSAVGTPVNRVNVVGKGGLGARLPVTTFTVGASTITIALTTAPPANAPLDISFGYPFESVDNGAADMIYDNGTDGDGLSTGRGINATYANPISVAAPTPSLGPLLTGTGIGFEGSITTGFGRQRNAGYAVASAANGDDVAPFSEYKTVQGFWTPNSVASVFVLYSAGGLWVGTTAAGKMQFDANGASGTGTTTMVAGTRYHWRVVTGPDSCTLSLGVAGGSAAVDASSVFGHVPTAMVAGIGAFAGGSFIADGKFEEVATFYTQLPTAYTVPTTALVGNEAGLYSLYRFNNSLTSG